MSYSAGVSVAHLNQPHHFPLLLLQQSVNFDEFLADFIYISLVGLCSGFLFVGCYFLIGEVDVDGCIMAPEVEVVFMIFEIVGMVEYS